MTEKNIPGSEEFSISKSEDGVVINIIPRRKRYNLESFIGISIILATMIIAGFSGIVDSEVWGDSDGKFYLLLASLLSTMGLCLSFIYWFLTGRESVEVGNGTLIRTVGVSGFQSRKAYDLRRMSDVHRLETAPASGALYPPPFLGGPVETVAFSYGGKTIKICGGLIASEADIVVEILNGHVSSVSGAASAGQVPS